MYPILLEIGGLRIGSYGVMLALAFLSADILFQRELSRRGADPRIAGKMFLAAIAGGVIGSKLLFLLENPGLVRTDFMAALLSPAGFSAYGGFALAIGLCVWVIRRNGYPFALVFDAVAPSLALAYGIARIGCFLAGDGCYGTPTDLPWGMSFPHGIIPTEEQVHPTMLYEFAWSMLVFGVLWKARMRVLEPFALFFGFLLLAGGGRFLVEFIRLNEAVWLGLTASQLLAAVMVVSGAWYFGRRLAA